MTTVRLLAVVNRFSRNRILIVNNLVRGLYRLQSQVDAFDGASVTDFANKAAVMVRNAQIVTAHQADAYLTLALRELGHPADTVAVHLDRNLRGTPEESVWQRPAAIFRTALDDGMDQGAASNLAGIRLEVMASDDLTRAMQEGFRSKIDRINNSGQIKITGYRRVVIPELSETGVCGLCVAATDKVYHPAELMPVHGHCKCTILPVVKGHDSGHALNEQELNLNYANRGEDRPQRERYSIKIHPELGPQLLAG